MTATQAIEQVLAADETLAGILTGGVHRKSHISRQLTPSAFDPATKELLACALVKAGTEPASGPTGLAGRLLINIFLYSRNEEEIEQAAARIHTLLHRQKIGEGTWEVRWAIDMPGGYDPDLLCPMGVSRYEMVRFRG